LARQSGRKGGLTKAALYDTREATAAARAAFRDSFLNGHACKVCSRIDIPAELPAQERRRRAEALRKRHFASIALQRTRGKLLGAGRDGRHGIAEGHGDEVS
jgi:hypothetical protein